MEILTASPSDQHPQYGLFGTVFGHVETRGKQTRGNDICVATGITVRCRRDARCRQCTGKRLRCTIWSPFSKEKMSHLCDSTVVGPNARRDNVWQATSVHAIAVHGKATQSISKEQNQAMNEGDGVDGGCLGCNMTCRKRSHHYKNLRRHGWSVPFSRKC